MACCNLVANINYGYFQELLKSHLFIVFSIVYFSLGQQTFCQQNAIHVIKIQHLSPERQTKVVHNNKKFILNIAHESCRKQFNAVYL